MYIMIYLYITTIILIMIYSNISICIYIYIHKSLLLSAALPTSTLRTKAPIHLAPWQRLIQQPASTREVLQPADLMHLEAAAWTSHDGDRGVAEPFTTPGG